jgi:hypothetical protein
MPCGIDRAFSKKTCRRLLIPEQVATVPGCIHPPFRFEIARHAANSRFPISTQQGSKAPTFSPSC